MCTSIQTNPDRNLTFFLDDEGETHIDLLSEMLKTDETILIKQPTTRVSICKNQSDGFPLYHNRGNKEATVSCKIKNFWRQ